MTEPAAAPARRPRLSTRSNLAFGVAVLLLVAGLVATIVAAHVAGSDRARLFKGIDPALSDSATYQASLTAESAGARGYALTGQGAFLTSYRNASTQAAAAATSLRAAVRNDPASLAQVDAIDRDVDQWLRRDVVPVAAGNRALASSPGVLTSTSVSLSRISAQFASLRSTLGAERNKAVRTFDDALVTATTVAVVAFAAVIAFFAALWLGLRRSVLAPLAVIGDDSRRVAAGELDRQVEPAGPAEVAELATAIEAMRRRVVAELRALEHAHRELEEREEELYRRGEELSRSNRDLEQFAYVASHDLQEPLRKVAAFCQLLSDRYGDQLDERAGQYIAFAVDGAKRMQALVNDLLAFSRVGRSRERWAPVDLGACLRSALINLQARLEDVDGRVEVDGELPCVEGDAALLTAVLQNLIGNSVKFRGEEPPVVHVTSRPTDEGWEVSVSDNGIGIEPQYAERVFTIFQRLHPRDRYEGTGIGLALCRRIVEFHGGHIWIDNSVEGPAHGTTIRFTLPGSETSEEQPVD